MRTLLPAISTEVLGRLAADRPVSRVQVGVDGGAFRYEVA